MFSTTLKIAFHVSPENPSSRSAMDSDAAVVAADAIIIIIVVIVIIIIIIIDSCSNSSIHQQWQRDEQWHCQQQPWTDAAPAVDTAAAVETATAVEAAADFLIFVLLFKNLRSCAQPQINIVYLWLNQQSFFPSFPHKNTVKIGKN